MSKPFEFDRDMPPLTVKSFGTDADGRDRGWGVLSEDQNRPLTERQAQEVMAGFLAAAEFLSGKLNISE